MSGRDTHDAWEGEIGSEVAFWRQWIATRGDRWPEDFAARMDPERRFDGPFAARLAALGAEPVRILDVGSGPLTSLGKRLPGTTLEVHACDPLAPHYDALLDEFGVEPPVRTVGCDGERLLDVFAPESFDATHARNALDHAYDPYAVVVNMLACVRPGGLVLLSHMRNEAVAEDYAGFHQWNFDVGPDGAFLIWHPRGVVDVTARLRGLAGVEVVSGYDSDWVEVVITRRAGTRDLSAEAPAAGFDRPLLELVVLDRAGDAADFRASVAEHVEDAGAVAVTVVRDEDELAALAPELPARAHLAAFLDVSDAFRAPFGVRGGAVSELARDASIGSRALLGGAPPAGLRGRLVRTSAAPELVARTPFEPARVVRGAAAPRPRAICVLGFHRSGTSMTTRLLDLLGVDLGPAADLVPAAEGDNPRGYWEPAWMVRINDALLAAHGGSDLEPPALAPGWHRAPELEPLRRRASELLDEKLAGTTVWAFKDPRTCLTLPFWQELLAGRVEDLRYVLCLRSPSDTAASMLRRDYDPPISADRWGALWLDYTARALVATEGAPRLAVFYDDLLRDGAGEASRLADFAGLPLAEGDRRARVEASIEPGLRHHASTPVATAADGALPAAARSAFLALRAAGSLRRAGDPTDLPAALERMVLEHWHAHRPGAAAGLHGALVDAIGALQLSDAVPA